MTGQREDELSEAEELSHARHIHGKQVQSTQHSFSDNCEPIGKQWLVTTMADGTCTGCKTDDNGGLKVAIVAASCSACDMSLLMVLWHACMAWF